jgi:ribosomal protein L40E/preprotein translocase subunit SecG
VLRKLREFASKYFDGICIVYGFLSKKSFYTIKNIPNSMEGEKSEKERDIEELKNIKYCSECGFQNNKDAKYCKKCGYEFGTKRRKEMSSLTKALLLIGAVLLFLGIPVFGAYFIWYKSYEIGTSGSPETIFPNQFFFDRIEFWHKMTIIGTILGIFVILVLVLYQNRRLKKKEMKNKKEIKEFENK